jgi:anti-sigma regulatory factor (Ser/Thr protein kinase)
MRLLSPQTVEILHPSNVGAARMGSSALAERIGFDPVACEEIALAMTELATNLIKHAQGGTLTLTPLADGGRIGLAMSSRLWLIASPLPAPAASAWEQSTA